MVVDILLYEDNSELRQSLASLIDISEGLNLKAAFENCSGILSHIDDYLPDVVLMDIDMPIMNGIEGVKTLRTVYDELPVIMLTVFEDNAHILEAIMNGATGYILKQHLSTRLVDGIHEVLKGGAPMSPAVARIVLQHINNPKGKKKDYKLTSREKDVLQSLTDGNSYKMVAAAEGISLNTVATHVKNIYEKLGVHSQAEAVAKTLREDIL